MPLTTTKKVGRQQSARRLWCPLEDKKNLAGCWACGSIKQALFIGPLLVCCVLSGGCARDLDLKCLRDLLNSSKMGTT